MLLEERPRGQGRLGGSALGLHPGTEVQGPSKGQGLVEAQMGELGGF